jgi:NitT/TauT family transport system permease protein
VSQADTQPGNSRVGESGATAANGVGRLHRTRPRRKRAPARDWGLRLLPFISVAATLLAWQLSFSRLTFIPAPSEVWTELKETLGETETYTDVWVSLRRLALGLVAGFAAGLVLSIQAGRSQRFERMLMTYVRVMLTLPSLLVALLSLVVFGIADTGVLVVVAVIVFPFVTVPVLQGVKSMDRAQLEMARVYNASTMQIVRSVAFPHLAPFLFSAVRNAHALAWKVLIVAEVFSVRSGIGYRFHRAFGLFDLPEVMVWLVIFLTVIAVVEYGLLSVVERWVFRWRPRVSAGGWQRGVQRLAASES